MNRKAVIFGIQKYRLTINEKHLFRKAKPWGIILFSRNIKNIHQVKNLVDDIKKFFKDKKYPILIDQEGGKVSRLNKIIDLSFFSQGYFGNLYEQDKNNFTYSYKIYINKVCYIFMTFISCGLSECQIRVSILFPAPDRGDQFAETSGSINYMERSVCFI